MASLFSSPSSSTPRVPPPPAIPEVGLDVEDAAARRARRGSGFRKTFLAGLLEPGETGKKTVLG